MVNHEVRTEIAGSVWQLLVEVGQHVQEGDDLLILESMKMEIPVIASTTGTVASIVVSAGDAVNENDLLAVVEAP